MPACFSCESCAEDCILYLLDYCFTSPPDAAKLSDIDIDTTDTYHLGSLKLTLFRNSNAASKAFKSIWMKLLEGTFEIHYDKVFHPALLFTSQFILKQLNKTININQIHLIQRQKSRYFFLDIVLLKAYYLSKTAWRVCLDYIQILLCQKYFFVQPWYHSKYKVKVVLVLFIQKSQVFLLNI